LNIERPPQKQRDEDLDYSRDFNIAGKKEKVHHHRQFFELPPCPRQGYAQPELKAMLKP
jgi:hypothetical protein